MCVFSPQVWDFETIDNADITEENTVFEMEPLTEINLIFAGSFNWERVVSKRGSSSTGLPLRTPASPTARR